MKRNNPSLGPTLLQFATVALLLLLAIIPTFVGLFFHPFSAILQTTIFALALTLIAACGYFFTRILLYMKRSN